MTISFNAADLLPLAPTIVVALFAMAILVADVFARPETSRVYAGYLTLAGLGVAFVLNLLAGDANAQPLFGGMIVVDAFSRFFNLVLIAAAALSVLSAIAYFEEHGLHRGEFYALVLLALAGMMLMAASADLLMFFVALEVMSIAVYVLAAYQRHLNRSIEAALKYFLMGAFSTAFLLFGIALLYGASGTTNLAQLMAFLKDGAAGAPLLAAAGMILVLVGFAFKVAAVPFHMWTPDVYEGAPTVVTGFMAAAVKAAAFAAFVRVFATAFFPVKLSDFGWYNVIWVLAVLTMTLGNLAALVQDNIKRMLAYSSIAHAGYLLVGFLTITQEKTQNGAASVLFYLAAYAAMNLGAFAVVMAFGRRDNENLEVGKGWAGLARRSPALGVAMTIFMLALAGVPPTAGFMGKFYVFKSAIDQGLILIAVIGIINSLISVYYYLRVTVYMYMAPEGEGAQTAPLASLPLALAVFFSAAAVLYLGILPSTMLKAAERAVASLF
ncbi:MAG: NADH-quinone oxidoreductase subunit N [Myxococcales bacterium]|nr:MAG: NADH-quinone oxidoreductase subunit N [Myxococcales bacterium]